MRILYIEDDARDAALAQQALASQAPEFRLDTVATLKEATERLEELDYDLILTDLRLPDGDGLELVAQIRGRGLPVAVVVVTGRGDEQSAVAALQAGANDYVVKRPDYLARLPNLLENALRRFRATAARRTKPIRALYAEHNLHDVDLTLRHMARYAPYIQLEVVHSAHELYQQRPFRGRFDLLLLDYQLPGTNGLEVLSELTQEEGFDLPVVIVTGRGDEEVAAQAVHLGAANYVPKSRDYLHRLPIVLENAVTLVRLEREQRALQESAARYRAVSELTSDYAYAFRVAPGGALVLEWVTGAFALITGYTPAELDAKGGWRALIHPDDLPVTQPRHQRLMAGETDTSQFRIITQGGEVRWLRDHGRPEIDPETGRVVRLLGGARDVTKQVQAEEALRHSLDLTAYSNRQLLAVTNAAQAILSARTQEAVYQTAGEAALELGYQAAILALTEDGTQLTVPHITFAPKRLRAAEKLVGASAKNYRFALIPDGFYHRIITSGQVVYSKQSLEPFTDALPRPARPLAKQLAGIIGFSPSIVAPLTVSGKVHALLALYGDDLTEADIPAVTLLANRTAAAIENAQLLLQTQQSERRFHGIFEGVQDAIFVESPDGRILDVNQCACKMFGYTREEFLTKTVHDLVPEGSLALLPEEDATPLLPGQLIRTVNLRSNGELFPVELSGQVQTIGDETVLLVVLRDVTERAKAEDERARLLAQIQDQVLQIQQIISTVPEGVLLLDADERVMLANPAVEALLPLLTDAEIGGPLTHLGDQPLAELLTSPPAGLWHAIQANGRAFELIARPIETGPTAGGWVLVIRDVTREREIQRQVQQQERLAAVGQLAAGIAHDFNNIMAVIVLYAQLSQIAPDLPPAVAERLHIIDQQARRATDLIQQILDFSHSAVLQKKPLSLLTLLKEQVKLLERTLPESIKINLTHGQKEYTTLADLTRIQQVLMNLSVNARDAMPDGGTLQIGLAELDASSAVSCATCGQVLKPGQRWVQLTVADTGTGIPADALPHIFEPFFTTKGLGKGTGLGLAQVYGIVKQHEGHIDVTTTPDRGTTFTVVLPALSVPGAPIVQREQADLTQGHGEIILVVEDNPQVRAALVEGLEGLNYRTLQASNGREALALYVQRAADIALVISDLVMPEMGGQALFHALRAKDPAVKMVLLTGHPMKTELVKLQAEGLSGWLLKPPELDQVAELVTRVLEKR